MSALGLGGTWDWMLNEVCTITAASETTTVFVNGDGIGMSFESSGVTASSVPCSLQANGSAESNAHGQPEADETFTLFVSDRNDPKAGNIVAMKYKGATTQFVVEGDAVGSGMGSGIRAVTVRRRTR